jgi:modulator of FtsH protease HflC
MNRQFNVSIAVTVVLVTLLSSAFAVNEGEVAVGNHNGTLTLYQPGLHWQWPFDHATTVDRRLVTQKLTGEALLSREQMALNVDIALMWKISDPAVYLGASGVDEQVARGRLADALRSDMKAAYGQLPLAQIISLPGSGFSPVLMARVQAVAQKLGIEVQAARVQRIDTTDKTAEVILDRMKAAFDARSGQIRAEGDAEASRLRAEADRNRTGILSAGSRDAQRIRGEGDGQAALIYARAYGRSPEFANFYRTLQAYRAALGLPGDILVIEPEGDFYKYLRSTARH